MTQTPQEWFEEFFLKPNRPSKRADGRALYKYRTADTEFAATLKGFLKLTTGIGSGISCLFCMRPNGGGDILMEVIGRGSLFLIL